MTVLKWSLIIAVLTLAYAVRFQIQRRKWRRQRLTELELKPNCLLTRHPIVFLSGRKSIFRFGEYWNQIPCYLKEHGYEVLTIEPSAHKRLDFALRSLTLALEDIGEKCHLIADSSAEHMLERIAEKRHPFVATLTIIKNPDRRSPQVTPLRPTDLRPRQMPIDVFELRPPELESGWSAQFSTWLLHAHSFLFANQKIDAIETAEIASRSPWALEECFLKLAISLAERDLYGE